MGDYLWGDTSTIETGITWWFSAICLGFLGSVVVP